MRLLIYAHFFAPSTGGVETYALLLASGFSERPTAATGEVTVATQTPAPPEFDSAFPFKVVRQPNWWQLLGLIRRASVVQLAGPSLLPMILALLLRKPLVVEQHGYQAACPNGLLLYEPSKQVCSGHFLAGRYRECLRCNRELLGWWSSLKILALTFPRRWLCRRAGANVAVTQHVARRLNLSNIQVIYHGVPDLRDSDLEDGLAKGEEVNPLCFAYVGRLVSEKGLPLLIRAARRLREDGYDFRLRFVGDGPERQALEALVKESELQRNITFTGFLKDKRLEVALSDAAAVVMPSIWEETAGLAAIEQMFRGRLVIASDIGGLGEIVGTAGMTFPPGDVEALASCMKHVLDKPDAVREFGRIARQRALECFGLDHMLKDHLALYRTLQIQDKTKQETT